MKKIFHKYVSIVYPVKSDLRFWNQFLDTSIRRYQEENPDNRWISDSLFAIYDIDITTNGFWLNNIKYNITIEIKDLQNHRHNFFQWVTNVAMVRVYNALEMMLIEAIHLAYFPTKKPPTEGKKELNNLLNCIRTILKSEGLDVDTKNNRHIIQFLKFQSSEFSRFLSCKVREGSSVNWQELFEMFSILRNVVAHQGATIDDGTQNELLSKGKDIYRLFFNLKKSLNDFELLSAKPDTFENFISIVDDFSGNTLKFIANEDDLKFLISDSDVQI